ncbi:MAG: SLBB domain-containing protein [Saprospiraceae bacterium]|nr:SLBB domain-containing protein [Saprospiraceae bacterium]
MKNLKYIFFLVLAFTFVAPVISQSITEQAAKEELARRGLADQEDRIKAELSEYGIDINNVDVNNPTEVSRVQAILEKIISKIEAEKKDELNAKTNKGEIVAPVEKSNSQESIEVDDTEVIKAEKDGATLDEAIVDIVRENEEGKLPDAITYGQHIFRSQSVKFYNKSSDAKAPSSYVLGPDDKISISIWGLSVYNESFIISKDGHISPFPDLRVYLTGLKLSDAKVLLKSKMANYVRFRKDDFDMSVLVARTINVNISGEVFNYGNFNVSALNNAFNVLVAGGGPSDIGTVRNIQLKRSGQSPKTLDIYKYIQDPIVGDNFFLQENDYIYVPVAKKLVTVYGAVNRSYKYELLPNETLSDLINYAGGLKSNALSRNIQIERRVGDKLEIIDVDFDLSSSKNIALQNGDKIFVQTVDSELEKVVFISGAVEVSGVFALTDNMTLVDLANKAKLKENAITKTIYLQRLNLDQVTVRYEVLDLRSALENPSGAANIKLQKGDKLRIKALSSFADKASFEVTGSVRSEGEYPINANGGLRVSDAIFLSGGLTKDAIEEYAYIYRKISPTSVDLEYVTVNLKEAIFNPKSESNIEILPNDSLVIYNNNKFKESFFVDVLGEVKNPRQIKYGSSLTLQDALRLAGGLKLESDPERINIYRVDFSDNRETKILAANLKINDEFSVDEGKNFMLQPFDQIIVRKAPDFELPRNVDVIGEVKYPGTYVLANDNTKILDLLADAGNVTDEAFIKGIKLFRSKDSVGYIIFDLEDAMKNPNSFNNIILQDGDMIELPKANSLVSISGATKANELYTSDVYESGLQTFPYEEGKNAKYYINKYAGGLSDRGDVSKIAVEYANGEVKRMKRFLFFRNYPDVKPGSKITVGYKILKKENTPNGEKKDIDWGSVLADSIAQATTVLSLILLLQSVD